MTPRNMKGTHRLRGLERFEEEHDIGRHHIRETKPATAIAESGRCFAGGARRISDRIWEYVGTGGTWPRFRHSIRRLDRIVYSLPADDPGHRGGTYRHQVIKQDPSATNYTKSPLLPKIRH